MVFFITKESVCSHFLQRKIRMKDQSLVKSLLFLQILLVSSACLAWDKDALEGTWRITSYFNAPNQVRYDKAYGYMMFDKTHYSHMMFINRDEQALDFSENHHGTYEITGPDTFDMGVSVDMHVDPKREFQDAPVWYGPANFISGLKYRIEGSKATLDFPSSTQIIMERVE